ncbi:MAG: tRNA 2-thiouridine(34) synthase MnmA [Epsilonproteobacteria bacterium]|nr:MAG: tRNA 2-thiouridine(34) synthase MnmA [Campylobacterota bacterium]
MKKVAVALSGGIDSSYTAYLLKSYGYEVVGIYMKLHDAVDGYHEKNLKKIKNVCENLNIPYHIVDMSKQFKKDVYDYFVNTYKDGLTPNPCVKCNRYIKFGALIDKAKELNCDTLSTGHYVKTDGEFLYEAADKQKDQSYFLSQVRQKNLKFLYFPLSDQTKEYVKEQAKNIDFLRDISASNESQEICFVSNSYIDILNKHYDTNTKGNTIDKNGKIIGTHKGYMHYTIGKRKGFEVYGALTPHYVLATFKYQNSITVGDKNELKKNIITIDNLNMFINEKEFDSEVRLRYRSAKEKCTVSIKNQKAKIRLKNTAFAVANGQYAVLYQKNKIVGSGVIINSELQDDIW